MDSEQQQEKYDKKLSSLQESMPFLLRVLEKLRNNNLNDPARQAQLEKMQKLYNLLNDKTQTLKWDTLLKCETVVNKLQKKMEQQTDLDLAALGRITPVNSKSTELTVNAKETSSDVACPESPPPQQETDDNFIAQPVEIPTERRCSPPIAISRHQKNYLNSDEETQQHWQQQRKSHSRRNSQHYQRRHQGFSVTSPSIRDHSNIHGSNSSHNSNFSIENERERGWEIRDESNSNRNRDRELHNNKAQNSWQRRNEIYSPEEVWDSYSYDNRHRNTQLSPNVETPYDSEIIYNLNRKPNTHQYPTSIFSRLGAKLHESDIDPTSPREFENFQINIRNNRTTDLLQSSNTSSSKSTSSIKRPSSSTTKGETLPFTPDLLKSPPLSATDISQLLNDTNSNSNSNMDDSPSISEVGTRRTTTTNTEKELDSQNQQSSSLDMVRKKFAMLTKREAPTLSDNSLSKNSLSIPQKQNVSIASNTTALPTERLALKYNPHPRASTSTHEKSINNSSLKAPHTHTGVNVLPTLRPNDPRLRAGSLINGDIATPTQMSNVANRQFTSSNSVSLSPNSPSPIYGNSIPNIIRSTPPGVTALPASQPKLHDPRLRRNAYPSTKKKSAKADDDSSEENWDTDESTESSKPHFPSHDNPFLSSDNMSSDLQNANRLGHSSTSSIPIRRKSTCWDNNSSPISNPAKSSPQEEWNTHSHNNWYSNTMSSKATRPYNSKFTPSPTERFNPTLNIQTERFKYLEAKKQKECHEPRTYGAYKEARARAAAEVVARKISEQVALKKSNMAEVIKTNLSKDEGTNKTNSNPAPIANTTLDTLYRSTNFTQRELSKNIGSFKIPKKQVVIPKEDKEIKTTPPKVKENIKNKTDEKPSKANLDAKKNSKENSVDILEKSVQLKPKSTKENSVDILEKFVQPKPKSTKENSVDILEKFVQPKPQRSCFSKKNKNREEDDAIVTESSKSQKKNESVCDTKGVGVETTIHSSKKEDSMVLDEITVSKAEVEKEKPKESPEPLKKYPFLQPGRILTRRCTMYDQASTPEVDKVKLLQSNAMLFEDLQERERKKELSAETKIQSHRRHVGEICYEKTDDGCTVSTQNIISGKRRTRTTANFNEVQQGIAVFKHIKQTDEKKDPTAAETKANKKTENPTIPHVRGKPGPKPKIKIERKSEETEVKSTDEGGNKIKKRQKTLVDEESKVKITKVEKTENSIVPNVTNIFDTFIQKLLNPDTNVDELINKLRVIMDEKEVETLLAVRSTIMKNHEECSETVAESEKKTVEKMDTDATEIEPTSSSQDKVVATQPLTVSSSKPKTQRRSELDRLHDDIRDMFISEGVLTATGKRMSTFVEPPGTTASKSECESSKVNVEQQQQETSTTTTTKPTVATKKRKVRETLPATKKTPQSRVPARRSLRKQETKEVSEMEVEFEIEEKEANTTSISSDTKVSQNSTNSSSTNKKCDMESISKSVEPIKLPEKDEDIDTTETIVKPKTELKKRYKPCPKSKKPAAALLLQEDEDDDTNTKENKSNDIAKTPKDEKNKIVCASPISKIKSEYDISVPIEVPHSTSTDKTLKNINPKWHCQSRYAHWCVLCDQKFVFLAMHYKKQHNEHYSSRLAPSVLHDLRQENSSLSKVVLKLKNKKYGKNALFLHRCPFCLQYKRTVMTGWMEHFITHTGEYIYECSLCHQSVNKLSLMEKHMKDKCAKLGGNYFHNDEISLTGQLSQVKAHICHICNYVRLGRSNLEHHYMEQHGYAGKKINESLGYTITLMDCDDASEVQTMEAILQMENKFNSKFNMQIIDLFSTENENKKEEENDEDQSIDGPLPLNDVFESQIEKVTVPIKTSPTIEKETGNEVEMEVEKNRDLQVEGIVNQTNETIQSHSESTNFSAQNDEQNSDKNSSSADNCTETSKSQTVVKTTGLSPVKVPLPPSSVFLSTTDDSNDGETSSAVLARKLLTVNDSESFDKNAIQVSKSTISIAERLSQRLKEAEATTITSAITTVTTATTTTTNTTTVLASKLLRLDENNALSSIPISSLIDDKFNQHPMVIDEVFTPTTTTLTTTVLSPKSSISISMPEYKKDEICKTSSMSDEICNSKNQRNSTIAKNSNEFSDKITDEEDIEIIEEDDDDWEDIEIVETAPSTNSSLNSNLVNKDSKTPKNKFNTLHKFSRLYASMAPAPKSRKKIKPFKLEKLKTDSEDGETVASTYSKQLSNATTKPIIGFRPMVANLVDLLPDSPCNDPIELAPELAPSSPLQELNDITTLLDSNLNGLMDMDVEAPTNSVCIHNTDNQQTSIQEALDFVNAQEDNFNMVATSTAQQMTSPSSISNCASSLPTTTNINRIQNIGFNCISMGGFKFYCFTERCTFLYSSESIGLKNHFLFEHPQAKWNGYCNTCKAQVKCDEILREFLISDEFNHMFEMHIKSPNVTPILTPTANSESLTAENKEIIVLECNDSNASTNRETPRIKLRRLSGDCLSTMTPNSDSNLSAALANALDDSNSSFSDLIRFNPRTITLSSDDSAPLPEGFDPQMMVDIPLFKNVSKDFEITAISSGLELSEISEIVSNVCKVSSSTDIINTSSPNISTNALPLQISSVVSLSGDSMNQLQEPNNIAAVIPATSATTPLLPKITNVCSLNTNPSTNKTDEIPLQVNEDCIGLQQSGIRKKEVADSLGNIQPFNLSSDRRTTENRPNSPEPMIVAETLPVAQATTGDFVITQTVSAQYAEKTNSFGNGIPKLGFNISISSTTPQSPLSPNVLLPIRNSSPNNVTDLSSSTSTNTAAKVNPVAKPILKCLERTCKFETRHFVAMIDHIKTHESIRDPTQLEYLRCSLCFQLTTSIDDYTQHVRVVHYGAAIPTTTSVTAINKSSTPTPGIQTTCALTEKIRNILGKSQADTSSNEQNSIGNGTVPRDISQNVASENKAFKEQLLDTINDMISKTGLSDDLLYCCLVKECNVKLNELTYHTHVLYHLTTTGAAKSADGNTVFSCPHCVSVFPNLSGLKSHIKSHGQHSFFCFMCLETAASPTQISQHFAQKHWIQKKLRASILMKTESSNGQPITYYVANKSSMTESEIRDFGKKLITEWPRKKAANRTHFYPNEYQLLPLQAIFSKEIFCALCLYKTKVRTNMVRHMIKHNNDAENNIVTGAVNANTVRTDGMTSELQTVIVANMDPINPVPCLISNERHFDRMTNLASSSGAVIQQSSTGATTNNGVGCKLRYNFIPMTRRFTCGVPGCQYLTISEDIFRSHLNTLHSDIRSYKCPFCKEILCKRSLTVEKIIQHLRFHDQTLYQCEQCDHSHYIRYVVERHALEKHGQVSRANIFMFIRKEDGAIEGVQTTLVTYGKQSKDSNKNEPTLETIQNTNNIGINVNTITLPIATPTTNQSKPSTQKSPKYICDLCGHKTFTHNQIIAHSNSDHGVKHPYQCPVCINFTAWNASHVLQHINENHTERGLKVKQVFHKMNNEEQKLARQEFLEQQQTNLNEMNTKPLWQRDDPSRVRQIRGIPMEDEEESERLSKRLRLNPDYDDNEDDDEIGVDGKSSGQSSSKLFLNRFEFGCFYCEYKTTNLDELRKTHWETVHNSSNETISKPYLFSILIRVRCPECRSFVGCGWELKNHFRSVHLKTYFIASDVRATLLVCGYCEFQCASPTQLMRHHQREDHQTTDVKCLSAYEMAQIIRLEYSEPEKTITYVHCSLCSELFSSRISVVQHARENHNDEAERFSFREMTNTTIYRCSECPYSSTMELTTLRHMINHYCRFKCCNFCRQPQTTFNGYMQHCYSDHRSEIRRFSEIYPLSDIRKFLLRLLIIFPNGWVVSKKNLKNTPYGNEERIKLLYAEICKTSQEPPIPRLSLGRLVARKSIEAKQQQQQIGNTDATSTVTVMQLAGNTGGAGTNKQSHNPQKISKRRSTIAFGNDEIGETFVKQTAGSKKQKLSTNIMQNCSTISKSPLTTKTLPPKFVSPIASSNIPKDENKQTTLDLKPYSYYGKRPDEEEWSKIFTKISIAGVNTPISLDKFKILVQIDARVKLEKLDITKLPMSSEAIEKINQDNNAYESVRKACPASQKYRFT